MLELSLNKYISMLRSVASLMSIIGRGFLRTDLTTGLFITLHATVSIVSYIYYFCWISKIMWEKTIVSPLQIPLI